MVRIVRPYQIGAAKSAPVLDLHAGGKLVLADPDDIVGEIGDEGRAARQARHEAGLVPLDHQGAAVLFAALGRDGDEGGPIILVLALHHVVADDLAAGAVAEVDHVIGEMATAIVEAVVANVDLCGAAFEVMAAIALIEAGTGNGEARDPADIDAMGAVEIAVAPAQMAESRFVDLDRGTAILAGQNAFLAVAEQAVADGKIALFEADTRSIAIGDPQILEDQAIDHGGAAAQHQSRLFFADRAVENRTARRRGLDRHLAAILHGALAIGARRDDDRALAIADRADRIGKRDKAPAIFGKGERGRRTLGKGRRGDGCGHQQQGQEDAHGNKARRRPHHSQAP